MDGDFLELIEESKVLNTKVFSLIRLKILFGLSSLGQDGSTYRELKAALELGDGALYANLKALMAMGYIQSETVELEGKKLEHFRITKEGVAEWERAGSWLRKLLSCGGVKG